MAVPNNTVTHHHVGEVQAEFKAGIRSEDFPHLANILINLYSDPIQAVIREYSTNALDAHIAAGNTDPILITLPSVASPEFIVQDFGIGLSIDDLRDVYSMYGRSLKRESNDFVGQLGLGCKSGLTYADSFTITAVKDGVKCVAMSTKDEHGVGTIRVIDTLATDEPNGVRIAIPVRTYDIRDFQYTADRLFQFWDEGTVLVNGKAPEVPEWRKQGLALDDDTWVIPTDAGLHSSYIVMGNVAYEVDDAKFGSAHHRQSRRFVARVNMGDIDFTPAREAIHNTAHTQVCLRELNDFIGMHFNRVLNERLSQCASRWDETLLKVLWKGSQMRVNADQAMPIWEYLPTAYNRKARAHTNYRFAQLTNTSSVVVTGFPNKSLSPLHRERLVEMFPACKQFVVIPRGADAGGFAGRENTLTWDEVVAATNDPSTAKGSAKRVGKRPETKYNTLNGPAMTAGELAALGTKVLYLFPREGAHAGTMDCTVVSLYSSNQIDRLRRLVPGITHYMDEYNARRDAILDAITDEDRAYVSAKGLHTAYSRLDPASIIDPDLAQAIRLYHQPMSDRLMAAKKFGVTVNGNQRDVNATFNARYPIIDPSQQYYAHRMPVEDVVMYINMKYASFAADKMSDLLDYDLPEDSLDALAS